MIHLQNENTVFIQFDLKEVVTKQSVYRDEQLINVFKMLIVSFCIITEVLMQLFLVTVIILCKLAFVKT